MEGECIAMLIDSVNYYEMHAEDFVASTLNVEMSKLYVEFEKYLNSGCKIMDLGCGSGRDSKYFIDKGYNVVAIDPSPTMCEKTKVLSGVTTYTLKAEELAFEDEFNAVWACASLLHVAREDQIIVFRKICYALKQGGIFYCSWKCGNQNRLEKGRYFTDFDEQYLNRVLADVPELQLIRSWVTTDVRFDYSEQKWLNVLLRKVIK